MFLAESILWHRINPANSVKHSVGRHCTSYRSTLILQMITAIFSISFALNCFENDAHWSPKLSICAVASVIDDSHAINANLTQDNPIDENGISAKIRVTVNVLKKNLRVI